MSLICSICGRRLKNPRSQELGYGPVCRRRMMIGESAAQKGKGREVVQPAGRSPNCGIVGQISFEDYLGGKR